ncbi:MAG: NTP transferase domain-containing protein [Actinobacteria bacterium]|nr:NTP transferase domain-containing protein [Actinomycetota bacterium]
MKTVIMAGGEGTRLRPLTSNQPKPMMPLVNRPMMEHIVRLLAQHGFDDIVVTVAFLANQIRNYFGDGSDFGVRLRYATDETPLGTAGSVRNASEELDDTFLVISGDVLTDIDLSGFVKAHRAAGAFASIALKRVENPLEFGIVITRPDGSVERFLEKPTWGQVFSDTANTGIYVLEPSVFDFIPEGEVVDFAGDVFPKVLAKGLPLLGQVVDGYWEDVGTLEAYLRAHQDVLDQRVSVEIDGFRMGEGVWLGENADVDPDARIEGPVVIGDNCRIEAGAHLSGYTVLGTDVIVKPDAFLERAVCHDHVYAGTSTSLRGCVIGRRTDLRDHARVEEGVVVGDECFVGERAVINPGVKIYPFKTVDAGAVVNSSIVWESRGIRTLFGRRGVRGLANVDVTPEVAVRLAMAYGTALKKGSVVTTSRDTSRIARALKRALIGGLNLAGTNVEDVELASVPLTRFQVRNGQSHGGITVRLAPGEPDSVEVRFFDSDGRDIDESTQRKIERLLYREDYRRALAGDIGDIVFPPRSLEFYTAALERSVDAERLRERAFKVVLDYSFGASSIVMPTVLAKIGAEVLAVNPFASTASATAAFGEPTARATRISDLVRASGSHLGLVVDPDGETAILIDDEGVVLRPEQALLALVALVASAHPGACIALPVSVSREAERIAAEHGAKITWTKLSPAHLMEVASTGEVEFAGSLDGGFIWPDFLPAFDATATLVKVLDLLAETGQSLSSFVRQLRRVHMAHETVATPWERKGAVMREMVEQAAGEEVVLVDGVKVLHPDGWALVLPDPEDAVTHVWAEAGNDQDARRLAQEYAKRIRQVVR